MRYILRKQKVPYQIYSGILLKEGEGKIVQTKLSLGYLFCNNFEEIIIHTVRKHKEKQKLSSFLPIKSWNKNTTFFYLILWLRKDRAVPVRDNFNSYRMNSTLQNLNSQSCKLKIQAQREEILREKSVNRILLNLYTIQIYKIYLTKSNNGLTENTI